MTHTIIIAEAGVNHNGSLVVAKQLIDAAAEAGVDYVKFQTFKAAEIASQHAPKATYQAKQTNAGESQLEMLRKLELSEAAHLELLAYCKAKNVQFLSTAFDLKSIDLLVELGITIGKIPSGELTNLPYLRKMANRFPELILSTGMADMNEIEATLNALLAAGAQKEHITILHCNTEYPTPMEDVNLLAMAAIKDCLGVAVGYSDHTAGIEVPVAAVTLGATVIEKHFTLDKAMEGPDHKASLEPAELKEMVRMIRNIEVALGEAEKQPSPSEIKNINIARKSIIAACEIKAGELLTEQNLTVKRPGNGVSPMRWDSVVGSMAIRDFQADELIEIV